MTSSSPLRLLGSLVLISLLLFAAGAVQAAADPAARARAAITNVYAGQSVIRFGNPHADMPATLDIAVYGTSDKTMLGRFQVRVPAMASVQVRPEELLQTFAPVNWDQLVVLYVQADLDGQLWHHLRRNGAAGDFADASVCTYVQGGTLPPGNLVLNATLMHAYAGPQEPYASFISLHSLSDEATSYEARIHDAVTGELMGRVDVVLEPHGSFNQSSSWYQNNAGWYFPRPVQTHMNIVFVPKGGARRTEALVVGHTLMNVVEGDRINLSNPCPMSPSEATRF